MPIHDGTTTALLSTSAVVGVVDGSSDHAGKRRRARGGDDASMSASQRRSRRRRCRHGWRVRTQRVGERGPRLLPIGVSDWVAVKRCANAGRRRSWRACGSCTHASAQTLPRPEVGAHRTAHRAASPAADRRRRFVLDGDERHPRDVAPSPCSSKPPSACCGADVVDARRQAAVLARVRPRQASPQQVAILIPRGAPGCLFGLHHPVRAITIPPCCADLSIFDARLEASGTRRRRRRCNE